MGNAEKASTKTKGTAKKRRFPKILHKDQLELFSMMFPVYLQVFIFCYIPMAGAVVAFKRYKVSKGIFGSPWCGLDNFKFFFKSMDAGRVIRNTLGYNTVFIILGIICAVFVAVLLSMIRSRKSLKFFQTTMLFPHFMSWVVVAYMLVTFLDYKHGMVNSFLVKLGLEKISWYYEPKYWPFFLVAIYLWKTIGYNSLVYYSSIINVDSALYESGAIDGCNTWQTIRHIMLPMIKPTIIIMAILAVGNIFRADFGLFYTVPQNSGTLISVTDVVDTYVYRMMFVTGDIGIAGAVGLIQSLVGLILVSVVNYLAKRVDKDLGLF